MYNKIKELKEKCKKQSLNNSAGPISAVFLVDAIFEILENQQKEIEELKKVTKTSKKIRLRDLTFEQMVEMLNYMTGAAKSEFIRNIHEVETGGYGNRRRLEFEILTSFDHWTKQYFEIDASMPRWKYYCKEEGKEGVIIPYNIFGLVEYCQRENIGEVAP